VAAHREGLVILVCTVLIEQPCVTDRWTDGQMYASLIDIRLAKHYNAVAHKNLLTLYSFCDTLLRL